MIRKLGVWILIAAFIAVVPSMRRFPTVANLIKVYLYYVQEAGGSFRVSAT